MSIWKKPKNYIEKKYNYIYKLTLKKDRRYFYIGKHSTNDLDDGYMGSGIKVKLLKKELGKNCFDKEILSFWKNVEDALIEEKNLVTKELIDNEFCLNTIKGGGTIDTTGLSHLVSEETRKKISEANKGRIISEKTKEKIRKSLLGKKRPKEIVEKTIKTKKEKGVLCCSEEAKRKIGDKNRGRKQSEEQKKLASIRHVGTKAVNKNGIVKYVKKEDLQMFLSNGWAIGTGKRKTNEENERNKNMVKSLWKNEDYKKNFVNKIKELVFINNGIDEKRIKKERIQEYIENGWVLGRCKIKKRK